MKKNLSLICLMALCTMFSLNMNAQTESGTLTLEIVDVTSDNPAVAAQAEAMKGTKTVVSFMGQKSVTKMDVMGGMVKIDLHTDEAKNFDMIMDAMGQKIWVNATKLEMDRIKAESDNPLEEMDITYDRDDTKEIAGYKCFKMNVSFPDNEDAMIEAYVTEDLDISAPIIQGVEVGEFEGFPLEYTFNNGMVTTSITAISFDDQVDITVFEKKTDGYQKMTMQDLINMTGGQMGF